MLRSSKEYTKINGGSDMFYNIYTEHDRAVQFYKHFISHRNNVVCFN